MPTGDPPAERRGRLIAVGVVALLAGVSVGALALRMLARAPDAKSPTIRFTIVPPAPESLPAGNQRPFAISPHGGQVVYVSSGAGSVTGNGQLMVRALDRLDAEPLCGIVAARGPFMSPDGKWIGYEEQGELRKVSITGGPPITVCRITGSALRGASWGLDDTIVFATRDT